MGQTLILIASKEHCVVHFLNANVGQTTMQINRVGLVVSKI